jgi:4'-phosphopantetheinyl transferase
MASNDILWPPPPARRSLGKTDVHVWAAHLALPPGTLGTLASVMSDDELQRAARFRFELHRNRFVAARGILRSLLAAYLDCTPDKPQFVYGANGKPALAGGFAESGLFFNIAHSEDIALIALTRVGPIGIDVEHIRAIRDAGELVERFFSERENALFQALPDDQKSAAFFNLWTRKEAWLKATGEGIGHSLNRVEVTFLPGQPARLLAVPEKSGLFSDWALCELTPANGFVGAIALPNVQFSISNFKYSNSELL